MNIVEVLQKPSFRPEPGVMVVFNEDCTEITHVLYKPKGWFKKYQFLTKETPKSDILVVYTKIKDSLGKSGRYNNFKNKDLFDMDVIRMQASRFVLEI